MDHLQASNTVAGLGTFTPSEMMWVLGMSRQAASAYMALKHPELTTEEFDKVLSSIKDKPVVLKQTAVTYDRHRNKFVAAAWLCGASLRQLGIMFRTSQQTMQNAKDKGLGPLLFDRNKIIRLAEPPMDEAKLYALREFYQELVRSAERTVEELDAGSLARMFHTMPQQEQIEQSAYDVPTPMTKLNNEVVE